MRIWLLTLSLILTLTCVSSWAQQDAEGVSVPTRKTTKANKVDSPEKIQRQMAFDSNQLVEGEIYRPDYSVVTGDSPGEGWGILRMRDNFHDHQATDQQDRPKKRGRR